MLEPLPSVRVEAVELVTVRLPLVKPFVTSRGTRSHRDVLLVHVLGAEAEGWAECAAEPEPTYDAEFTAGALLVLRDHLLPLAWSGPTGDAAALSARLTGKRRSSAGLERGVGHRVGAPRDGAQFAVAERRSKEPAAAGRHGERVAGIRGHHMARAALELAVLDAQLRAAGRSLASWLGATAPAVPAGAALGLHDDIDQLLAEAGAALAAGASRLRVKIAPGRAAEPLAALRDHVGADVALQADANASFDLADDAHVAELQRLDGVRLACLEQPLAPDDLLAHAHLAERLETPICLDESLTSLAAVEAAHALGACEVVCLKPARVGGWMAARAIHDRCVELGLPMWVGGMLETGVGRAANLAAAALPGMTLSPDMDPRPRYGQDLAEWQRPGHDGLVAVPDEPGACPAPDAAALAGAQRELHRRP